MGRYGLKGSYIDLERNKCLPSCNRTVYNIQKQYDDKSGKLFMSLSPNAMNFLQVTEHFVMTAEDLVANIGGTVGIFLGVSCFTGIPAVEYVTKLFLRFRHKF